ncbi:MAG TPA: SGNH/GDSL hydrolase family protein [Syntrophorhabdales bacterium]|nr:SGNH/GDSL hydrolase family protein [Syntrophorhabdales bacterium]
MITKAKRIFWYIPYLVLSSLFLLIILEFAVRVFFPQINYQGVQRSLFVENKFGQTMGLAPNSSGEIFGKEIHTDEYGFRQMNTPAKYHKSWLFLGDSVTFGAGIDTDQIFPQLIQNAFPDTKIWNTAVVGYSAPNYLDVVKAFLPDHPEIEKIVLFFCLNDVYGNLSLKFNVSAKERILSFLRSHSKLYSLVKKTLLDASKMYALYDIGLYKEGNSDLDEHLNAIVSIKSIADRLHIDFLVVILPYEYQLRVGGLRAPQVLLKNFFAKNNVASVDLYEEFTPLKSEDYFLYGDPMHLSTIGHRTVARKMIEILK